MQRSFFSLREKLLTKSSLQGKSLLIEVFGLSSVFTSSIIPVLGTIKAFIPDGQMRFVRNDTLFNVSLKDFMVQTRNTGRKQNRKTNIENVQVCGNAATAKLTIEYPKFYFHDIMSLLKTKDGGKIVSKIYYREDKPK